MEIDDIDSSKVMFQARTKGNMDWEMMNNFSDKNKDSESFIDDITKFYTIKAINDSQYDQISDEPQEYIEKQILKNEKQ